MTINKSRGIANNTLLLIVIIIFLTIIAGKNIFIDILGFKLRTENSENKENYLVDFSNPGSIDLTENQKRNLNKYLSKNACEGYSGRWINTEQESFEIRSSSDYIVKRISSEWNAICGFDDAQGKYYLEGVEQTVHSIYVKSTKKSHIATNSVFARVEFHYGKPILRKVETVNVNMPPILRFKNEDDSLLPELKDYNDYIRGVNQSNICYVPQETSDQKMIFICQADRSYNTFFKKIIEKAQ